MSQLTTHILDTGAGRPADGVTVILYELDISNWKEISRGITNSDGRIADLLAKDVVLQPGTYKLRFETQKYFEQQSVETFYPFIEIVFEIKDNAHYHVPLLLNAWGYSTYRGS
jgi:5-hydroxyisourate hydrolase